MHHAIREAVPADVPALSRLMSQLLGREITEDHMRNRLDMVAHSPFDTLYVYEEERIWGAMGFRIRENLEEISRYGEISVLVVDRDAKRRGIGSALAAYAEELAVRNGCKGTWLVSGYGRAEEAHKFYRELGFEETGIRFVKPL